MLAVWAMPRLIATLLVGFALIASNSAMGQNEEGVRVVVPKEIDDLLANPGMGWETFHRTGDQDANLPHWIPSTVHYVRWGWNVLEPEPGRLNATLFEETLQQTRAAGQKLAFRVMCCSPAPDAPYHPRWLRGEISCDYQGKTVRIPDFDHPDVLKQHLDFIRRLGGKYDGHPDIDHVDLGSIGWWGEWHLSGSQQCKLPSLASRMAVVDAYLGAFRKTPLLMLLEGGECLKHATRHGAGWRADCLGDLGLFADRWNHMRQGYPAWLQQSGALNVWRKSPVAWETCGDMRDWISRGWSLRYIFNYALALHASYINNKSAPLPADASSRAEIERFLRRLGYRLVLKEWKHPLRVKAGTALRLSMKWQNLGSAPCYRPYRLAYRLTDDHGRAFVGVGNLTVNRWLPGSIDVFTEQFFREPRDLPPGEIMNESDHVILAENLRPGRYALSLAVVDHRQQPVVRLAIAGREEDGWYRLSEVWVTE